MKQIRLSLFGRLSSIVHAVNCQLKQN